MIVRWALAPDETIALLIVAAIAAVALLAAANRVHLRIMALVNLKLPQTSRFPGPDDPEGNWVASTWRSPTTRRVHQDYRKFYPGGRLVRLYWFLVGAGFACVLLACFLFPLKRQGMSN